MTRRWLFASLSFLSLFSITACGVDFSSTEPGTEFFKDIAVSGDLRSGAPLTVVANYEQYYPADVEIACELRRERSLVKALGSATVPALIGGTPRSTPVAGHVAFDFTVDAPGRYRVECLTPRDQDNYIAEYINVGP